MADTIWSLKQGEGPLLATAIHDGHVLRDEVAVLSALTAAQRLREEDPHTAGWTEILPTRVRGLRSRFEVDLNRPRQNSVYRRPQDAWGLDLWRREPDAAIIARSLAGYDAFYAMLDGLLDDLLREHGRVLVLDIHSYNHRRGGPGAEPDDPRLNPQINVGTGKHPSPRWRRLIERFIAELAAADFPGGRLDVRENVKFRGGHMSDHIRGRRGEMVCVLSIEVKKFFMDEWTGEVDDSLFASIREALRSTLPGLREELAKQ